MKTMKKMKKVMGILLAMVLVLTAIPLSPIKAYAVSENSSATTPDGYPVSVSFDESIAMQYDEASGYTVVLPAATGGRSSGKILRQEVAVKIETVDPSTNREGALSALIEYNDCNQEEQSISIPLNGNNNTELPNFCDEKDFSTKSAKLILKEDGDEKTYSIQIKYQATLYGSTPIQGHAISVGDSKTISMPAMNGFHIFEYECEGIPREAGAGTTEDVRLKLWSGSSYALIEKLEVNGKGETFPTPPSSIREPWTYVATTLTWRDDHTAQIIIKVTGNGAAEGYTGTADLVPSIYTITCHESIKELKIEGTPKKTEYQVLEPFEPDGITVKAVYADGTDMEVPVGDYTISYSKANASGFSSGDTSVTIKYRDQSTKFEGIKVSEYFEQAGTGDDPYQISTQDDLAYLSRVTNSGQEAYKGKYFKMTTDLTLPGDWLPIGGSAVFQGSLDGGDHTLTVPKGSRPLFNEAGGGTIKDLKVFGEQIEGNGLIEEYSGGLTVENITLLQGTKTLKSGLLGGDRNTTSGRSVVTIRDCRIEPGVVVGYDGSQSYIGGFAGAMNGIIENCVNEGEVKGVGTIGGIVGIKCQTIGIFQVRNCTFSGIVSASGSIAGGIVGSGYSGEDTRFGAASAPNSPGVWIQNCISSGRIIGGDKVGGILGAEPSIVQAWATSNSGASDCVYVQNNLFMGSVKATSGTQAGGIIGYMHSLNKNTVITNNYYDAACGAEKGIGGATYVDTNHPAPDKSDSSVKYFSTEGAVPSGVADRGLSKKDCNRTDDPLGKDADTLARAVSAGLLKDGTVTNLLNRGENSLHNWVQGSSAPQHTDKTIVYKLEVSGQQEQYNIGDAFSIKGMKIIAYKNDGSDTAFEIPVDDPSISITGYDLSKQGTQTVTVEYSQSTEKENRPLGYARAEFEILVLYENPTEVSVKLSIYGDTAHGEQAEKHTLADGGLQTWFADEAYTMNANNTVWDLLQKAAEKHGLVIQNPTGNYVESVTNGDITIGEFTNGANSGWMYTVNGKRSSLGVNEQYLSAYDEVVFHYTDDHTKESWGGEELTAADVSKLIEALPAPEKLTLDDDVAVAEAQNAYASLSESEKTKVPQKLKDKLDAAVKRMAELKKASVEGFEDAYKNTGSYLGKHIGKDGLTVGEVGGDWTAMGLARSGKMTKAQKKAYYDNVAAYVKQNANAKEQLHRSKSTENSRVILALTAAGYDVTDVAGHNLLQGLTDMDYLTYQGINGPIWALIAFDSHDYDIPKVAKGGKQVSREGLIDYILSKQTIDGGWDLAGKSADPDMTAMALQALAPYYDSSAKVKNAVDRALSRLSAMQLADGSYASTFSGINIESCAQVVVALTSLGIDPATDSRFVKNGNSVMDALLNYYVKGGGFRHMAGGKADGMATEQGYYALTAYARFVDGKNSLYDMSDVKLTIGGSGSGKSVKESGKTNGKSAAVKDSKSKANTPAARTLGRSISARDAETVAAGWAFTGGQYSADQNYDGAAAADNSGFAFWLILIIILCVAAVIALGVYLRKKQRSDQ